MNITVLGTGTMGAGMARNLAKAGLRVTVWNRSLERARPLADEGITVAEELTEAIHGADVVLTILFDTDSTLEVMEQAFPAFGEETVWVQCATVGLEGIDRLAEGAERHHVALVDAPVLGSRAPAESGSLVVLASGSAPLRERVQPALDAIGSRTVWVSDTVGDAQRLKITVQSWTLSITAATAQAVALASAVGLDPQLFLGAIEGTPTDAKYAQLKGAAMIAGSAPTDFAVDGAIKDNNLVLEAMRAVGTDDTVMVAVRNRFRAASDAGHGAEDMAAVIHAFRQE